jgi:hypothetical protein
MNDRSVFSIREQHAGRDIFNIARDLIINQNSPAEDILKIIEAIQHKVGELDIESIKKTSEILKEAKTTGETLKDIGVLVGKAAAWLGTTAAKLGWMF